MLAPRKLIFIAAIAGAAVASYNESVAGLITVFVGWFIALQCHAIEVKLNKLLDAHRIIVTKTDLEG